MTQRTDIKTAFLRTGAVEDASLAAGLRQMFRFYQEHRVADAAPDDEDGDMLLFEWGRRDWGDGPGFEVSIARQIIFPDSEDQDIWQLRLCYRYDLVKMTAPPKSGAIWCSAKSEVRDVEQQVLNSVAVTSVQSMTPSRIGLSWQNQ